MNIDCCKAYDKEYGRAIENDWYNRDNMCPIWNPGSVTHPSYWEYFKPSQHPDQLKWDKAISAAKKMTPSEFFESSVRAGIHNPDGTLTEMYREPAKVEFKNIDVRYQIEDVYGVFRDPPSRYPTLDGLAFKEWEAKHANKN